MGWTQTQRVLLVWPDTGRVLARRLDLTLLHRHAHRLGAQLALVTTDPVVREHAQDLGLAAFDSIAKSRRERWRSKQPRLLPQRLQATPDFKRLIPPPPLLTWEDWPVWAQWVFQISVFLVGLSALLGLAYALIPAATITVRPAAHPIHASAEVIADANLHDIAGLLIPARPIVVEVEKFGVIPTTGLKAVPDQPATGKVIFTNLVGVPATIPQGTGVRTSSGDAIRFLTTHAVNIEGRLNAVIEVEVKAVKPGPEGNVALGLINAIDGPLGLQLAVTNPAPTHGGTVAQQHAVTDADRLQLRQQLMAELTTSAAETIRAQLQNGEFLAEASIAVQSVVAETYDQAVGEAAESVGLTLRIAARALAIKESDTRLVARALLGAQVPPNEALLPGREQLERDPVTTMDADGRARFLITATGEAVPLIEQDMVRQLVKGQSIDLARNRLTSTLALAEPPQVAVWPEWYAEQVGYLPWLIFRINLVVE